MSKLTVGKFIIYRQGNPDIQTNQFAPGGTVSSQKDFIGQGGDEPLPPNVKLSPYSDYAPVANDIASQAGSSRFNPLTQAKSTNFLTTHPHSDPWSDDSGRYSAQLDKVDLKIYNFLTNVGQGGDLFDFDLSPGRRFANVAPGTGLGAPGAQALNPRIYARELVNLGKSLSSTAPALDRDMQATRLARFAIENVLLYSMNRHGKIWNPLTVAPPPIAGNFIPGAIDVLTGTPNLITGYDDSNGVGSISSKPGFYERNHGASSFAGVLGDRGGDIHATLARGNYNEVQITPEPPFVQLAKNVGATGPTNLLNLLTPSLVGAQSQKSALVDDPLTAPFIPGTPLVKAALTSRNVFTPDDNSAGDRVFSIANGAPFTIAGLVKEALSSVPNPTGFLPADPVTGIQRFSIGNLFNPTKVAFGGTEFRPLKSPIGVPLIPWQTFDEKKLQQSFFPNGIVPAAFNADNAQSFVTNTDLVDDDEAYVPLCFTDLRPFGGNSRTVYFRPFITQLSEEMSPEWNRQSYFGRVDPVMTYQSTIRTVQLGFVVQAFSPQDLQVIYRKLNWLASMVYPSYDKELLYKSGPVCRLRVGDIIASSNNKVQGLSGVIENLSFDYTDAVWELTKKSKAPMGVKVSLSFTVLHDVPIGVGDNGAFGGLGKIDSSTGLYTAPAGMDGNSTGADVQDGAGYFRSMGNTDSAASSTGDFDNNSNAGTA